MAALQVSAPLQSMRSPAGIILFVLPLLACLIATCLFLYPFPPISLDRFSADVAHSAGEKMSVGSVQNKEHMRDTSFEDPVLETLEDVEAVWQIPQNPKAAVFFAHGCSHKATHFFRRGKGCETCIGLPEDSELVMAALRRGYAVLALSSIGFCWNARWPAQQSSDAIRVTKAIATWRERNGLSDRPIAALGASSGGYFVSVLAHMVDFHALAVMISSGVTEAFQTPLASGKAYPPTLFLHMPKDLDTGEGVRESINILREKKVEVGEVLCHEVPLTSSFFTERIPNLDFNTSFQMVTALKEGGFLSEEGILIEDGRNFDWKSLLAKKGILAKREYSKYMWESAIEEELNLAFSYHEMTSLNSSVVSDWFDGVCPNGEKSKASRRCEAYD